MKCRNLIFVISLLLASCSKFEYSPNHISQQSEYVNINQTNISNIATATADTIRIAVIGDSQSSLDATQKTIGLINENDIHFVIHTGDLVDLGLQREYIWMHELLCQLKAPYVAVVGNHDMIANGAEIYKKMYGEYNFSFKIEGIKFIFLNTNSSACAYANNVPDISWLDSELADTANYEKAIIVNHVQPLDPDFNPGLKDAYVNVLNKYGKVMMEINGHIHEFSYTEPFNDGIPYLNTWSTDDKKFVLLKIWHQGFSIKTIE